MKTHMKSVLSVILVLTLAACATGDYGQKQVGGTILGGALGGFVGSKIGSGKGQLAATAIGALLGAYAGSEAGKSLDRADRLYAARSQQVALETNSIGQSTAWSNPDSGNTGSATPTRTWRSETGRYCREYRQTVTVAGRTESAYGTACRQPDGTWQLDNS